MGIPKNQPSLQGFQQIEGHGVCTVGVFIQPFLLFACSRCNNLGQEHSIAETGCREKRFVGKSSVACRIAAGRLGYTWLELEAAREIRYLETLVENAKFICTLPSYSCNLPHGKRTCTRRC